MRRSTPRLHVLALVIALAVAAAVLVRLSGDSDTKTKDHSEFGAAPKPTLLGREQPNISGPINHAQLNSASADLVSATPPSSPHTDHLVDITVHVVTLDGTGIEGVGVIAASGPRDDPTGDDTRLIGRTNAMGLLPIRTLMRSDQHLRIEKNGPWKCHETYEPPGVGGTVVFTVGRLVTVRGVVVDSSGTPAGGHEVLAEYLVPANGGGHDRREAVLGRTPANGRFRVSVPSFVEHVTFGVREGDGWLVQATTADTPGDVVLKLGSSVLISGIVLDPGGRPVSDATVSVIPLDGGPTVLHDCQLGGEFEVSVPRPGRYLVTFTPMVQSHLALKEPLEVVAPAKGVRLSLNGGLRLEGHVTGANGRHFDIAWQRRWGPGERLFNRLGTRSGQRGHFSLAGLSEGNTMLYAFDADDDRYALIESPRLPNHDLKLRLRKGLSIRGTVSGPASVTWNRTHVVAHWRGFSRTAAVSANGTFLIRGLPPGTYQLGWRRGRMKGILTRMVEAGDHEVRLQLPATRPVRER